MRADFRCVVLAGWMLWLLGPAAAAAEPLVEVDAMWGQPWGVGRLVIELGPGDLPEPLGIEGLGLDEKNGRVFYPAIHNPAAAALMREFLAEGSPLTSGGPVREEVGGILRAVLERSEPRHHPLPVPRQRPAGADAPGAAADPPGGAAPRAAGLAAAMATDVVAGLHGPRAAAAA